MELLHLSHHIAHATATLAELTLALSIGSITKILVQAPIVDPIARETTVKRIQEEDGFIATCFYKFGCKFNNSIGMFARNIPWITFIVEMAVLFLMAFETGVNEAIPFFVSLVSFVLVIGYAYFNSETYRKTTEKPKINPTQ